MKAITICNPYPELILLGEKPIENRDRHWSYRGQLFIHAGLSRKWMSDDDWRRFPTLPYGAIVGVMTVVACLELYAECDWPEPYRHLQEHEHAYGPWCLILQDVKRLRKPVPCKGALGVWTVPADIQPLVRAQLQEAA